MYGAERIVNQETVGSAHTKYGRRSHLDAHVRCGHHAESPALLTALAPPMPGPPTETGKGALCVPATRLYYRACSAWKSPKLEVGVVSMAMLVFGANS